MAMGSSLDEMGTAAVALVALAAVTLTGIAVITGFKDTLLVDNTTADKFVTGLTVFASFSSVIALAIVGKLIVGMFTKY